MYADRDDLKDKEIKVRLNRFELAELDEAAGLSHQQRAVLMRELVRDGAKAILERFRKDEGKHKRNVA